MSKRTAGISYGTGMLARVAEFNRKRNKKVYKHPAARKQAKLKRVKEVMETQNGS